MCLWEHAAFLSGAWVCKCCWSSVYDSVSRKLGRGHVGSGVKVVLSVSWWNWSLTLNPENPGGRAGRVSLAAFTARLPVGTCKALGSWQPGGP